MTETIDLIKIARDNPYKLYWLLNDPKMSYGDLARAILAVQEASDQAIFESFLCDLATSHPSDSVREASVFSLCYIDTPAVRLVLGNIKDNGRTFIVRDAASSILSELEGGQAELKKTENISYYCGVIGDVVTISVGGMCPECGSTNHDKIRRYYCGRIGGSVKIIDGGRCPECGSPNHNKIDVCGSFVPCNVDECLKFGYGHMCTLAPGHPGSHAVDRVTRTLSGVI